MGRLLLLKFSNVVFLKHEFLLKKYIYAYTNL